MAKVYPKRIKGMEQVFFDGSESLPTSKFCLIFDELKQRILQEEYAYSKEERKQAFDLVNLASNLIMLYVSQDTPLYSTQNTMAVNNMADDLVVMYQPPMTVQDMPPNERRTYTELLEELKQALGKRNRLLSEFADVEKFMRTVDYTSKYSVSCLLGMSSRVRKSMERLSAFNRAITERFNLMSTHVGADNVYKVAYVLEHIGHLQKMLQEAFPEKFQLRNGDYEKVFRSEVNSGVFNIAKIDTSRFL
ncbi:hypothetical protein [Drosophila suzukii associated hytrosavirus 1]|nr:hypothetical protein [Drosophila suzukii associated hytrosavirus 1]